MQQSTPPSLQEVMPTAFPARYQISLHVLVALCGSLFGSPAVLFSAAAETGQHPAHLEKKVGEVTLQSDYLLFLPADYGKDLHKKWPLMLFLHGSGERGTDLDLVKKHGPPKIVERTPDFPFIVVSPQCPLGVWWQTDVLERLAR